MAEDVSPPNENAVGSDGMVDSLGKIAEKIKASHIREVAGTPYQYTGNAAGHLPDTNWSGRHSPYCWHQRDGFVNSKVGRYALKCNMAYEPTGFSYAGVDGEAGTYTTERVTGSVSSGRHGIRRIGRP
ncbi:hypothetical protein [Streptomyces sp. NPDC059169]|uniref:hypothetical protein n=1 Tax=unclassified Streptomyces TaxID=2593676 RepID=UPI0036BD60E1